MVELTSSRVEKKGKFVAPKAVPKNAARRRPGAPQALPEPKKVRFETNPEPQQLKEPQLQQDTSTPTPTNPSPVFSTLSSPKQPASILKTSSINSPPTSQASLILSSQRVTQTNEEPQSELDHGHLLTPPMTQEHTSGASAIASQSSILTSSSVLKPSTTGITPRPLIKQRARITPSTMDNSKDSLFGPKDDQELPPEVPSVLLDDPEDELDHLSQSLSYRASSTFRSSRSAPRIQSASGVQPAYSDATAPKMPGNSISLPNSRPTIATAPASKTISQTENQSLQREDTPKDPSELSLKQLIKHKMDDGKLSTFEKSRRQAVREARLRKKEMRSRSATPISIAPEAASTPVIPKMEESVTIPTTFAGPRVRMVNGVVTIDESSLLVDTVNIEGRYEDMQRVEEGSLRYVTSASFRSKKKEGKIVWTKAMTARFFDGLSYFGTNFGLIALMFPGMSRAQIKLKYNHEEKLHPVKLTNAIYNRKTPDNLLRQRMRAAIEQQKRASGISSLYPSAPILPENVKVEASSNKNNEPDDVTVNITSSSRNIDAVNPEQNELDDSLPSNPSPSQTDSTPLDMHFEKEEEDHTLSLLQKTVARMPIPSKSGDFKPKIAPRAPRTRRSKQIGQDQTQATPLPSTLEADAESKTISTDEPSSSAIVSSSSPPSSKVLRRTGPSGIAISTLATSRYSRRRIPAAIEETSQPEAESTFINESDALPVATEED